MKNKHTQRGLYGRAVLLCVCMLCACGKKGTLGEEDVTDETMDEIPVLSIDTVGDNAGNMDFVTKPVARHVVKSIASWTHGYVMPPEPYYVDCTISLTDIDEKVVLDKVEAKDGSMLRNKTALTIAGEILESDGIQAFW